MSVYSHKWAIQSHTADSRFIHKGAVHAKLQQDVGVPCLLHQSLIFCLKCLLSLVCKSKDLTKDHAGKETRVLVRWELQHVRLLSPASQPTGSPVWGWWGGVAADWEPTGFSQTSFPAQHSQAWLISWRPHAHYRSVWVCGYVRLLYIQPLLFHVCALGRPPYQTGTGSEAGVGP